MGGNLPDGRRRLEEAAVVTSIDRTQDRRERDARLAAFIAANTRLLVPPLVPEIKLHLAEESVPIWQKTEEELGEMNVPPPFWAFAWAGGQALARYLLDNPALVSGKAVLDLGTGSGLTAIAAMMAGAAARRSNRPPPRLRREVSARTLRACCATRCRNACRPCRRIRP